MDAADRRGRRASWIAAALFILVVVAVRVGLGERLARERYLTLREHEFRRNRFEIARILDTLSPGRPCPIVVWEVEGVSLEELVQSEEWSSRPHVVDLVADGGGPSSPIDLVRALMQAAGTDRDDAAMTAWRCDLISSRPIEPDAVSPAFVDGEHDDIPDITPYRLEGDASWVALETIRVLERPPVDGRLVWARHTEPTPPHLAHAKFRGDARASELSATAFYVERLGEYLRRRGCSTGRLLLVTARPRGLDVAVFGEIDGPEQRSLSGFVGDVIDPDG